MVDIHSVRLVTHPRQHEKLSPQSLRARGVIISAGSVHGEWSTHAFNKNTDGLGATPTQPSNPDPGDSPAFSSGDRGYHYRWGRRTSSRQKDDPVNHICVDNVEREANLKDVGAAPPNIVVRWKKKRKRRKRVRNWTGGSCWSFGLGWLAILVVLKSLHGAGDTDKGVIKRQTGK